MKEYYLDYHTDYCKGQNEGREFNYCDRSPQRFLFFLHNKFHIITYHLCHHYDHIEYKKELLNLIIEKNKIYEKWEVRKSQHVDVALKNFRLHDKNLKKYHTQVNYLYGDNAGKQYAITTEIKYLDFVCDLDEFMKNYKSAKDYLKENDLDYLEQQLEDLYEANVIYDICEVEKFKTIEHLIKLINEKTK
jgi:hypothetical protein